MTETPQEEKIDHGKRLASWTFPEFTPYKRSTLWFVIAIALLAALLIYAITSKNYLFAVFLALAAFIYTLVIQQKPRLITFTISEDGLEVHEVFYPFKDIAKFWIIYEPQEVKTLYFEFQTKIRPMLSIPLETQNPLVIRDVLLTHLKEDLERDEELLSDAIQRKLKM